MATTTESNHRGNTAPSYGGGSFAPVEYDVDDIKPDAHPGNYESTVATVQFKPTNDGRPQLILGWKLNSLIASDEPDAEQSVGASVDMRLVFDNSKAGNRSKQDLRTIRDAAGLDPDVIPTRIATAADLKELIAALKTVAMPIWVTTSPRADGGGFWTNIRLTAPFAGIAAMVDEEEEAAPARGKKAEVKPKGKSARR
jgi:hypothetical protein